MMRVLRLFATLAILGTRSLYGQEAPPLQAHFAVIINAQNPMSELARDFLEDVYLKKVTRWPRGGTIQPVDLAQDSAIRREFSEAVLHRSVAGIEGYWQQLIFSGQNVPPVELPTDKEVVQYVIKNPGAIGYVASKSTGSAGIKTIGVRQ